MRMIHPTMCGGRVALQEPPVLQLVQTTLTDGKGLPGDGDLSGQDGGARRGFGLFTGPGIPDAFRAS